MTVAQIVAFLAAALVAMLASTPFGQWNPGAIVARSVASLLIAYFAAILSGRATLRFIQGSPVRREQRRQLSTIAAAATWLVPALLLLRASSPWAAACAIVCVALSVSATGARWRESSAATSFLTSITLQAGVLALAVDALLTAVAALSLATWLVAVRWSNIRRPAGPLRAAFTLAVAFLVMLGFLLRTYVLAITAERSGTGAAKAIPVYAASGNTAGNKWPHADPGVILYPKVEPKPIQPPPVPSSQQARQQRDRTKALEIPFSGVYWYFHPPWLEPPPTSAVRHGDAASFRFRTADQRPIRMQARQNLGRMINLNCCTQLDLVLQNADSVRGTVEVEVELINTKSGATRSLGRRPVLSTQLRTKENRGTFQERLTFPLISAASLAEFDEFRVVFHLGWARASRGAQVAIERFILMPRAW